MSGRGGRGQALLAALNQPVRKPGLQQSNVEDKPKVSSSGGPCISKQCSRLCFRSLSWPAVLLSQC